MRKRIGRKNPIRQEGKSYLPRNPGADITNAMSDVRKFLVDKINERGESLSSVSTAIGKNHAYLQQYVHRYSPRRLSEETRQAIATVLGCSADDLKEDAAPSGGAIGQIPIKSVNIPGVAGPTGGPLRDRSLPILGRLKAGERTVSSISIGERATDWTFRPPELEGVDDAYGTYIYGDIMSPAFESGDIAFVHPHLPVVPGKNVHIILHNDDAFVRHLVGITGGKYLVREYNPERTYEIDESQVRHIRRVVGRWEK